MGSGCWRSGCIYSFVFGLYQLPCELPGVPEPFHSQSVAEPIVSSRSISASKLVGMGTIPMGGPTVFWPPCSRTHISLRVSECCFVGRSSRLVRLLQSRGRRRPSRLWGCYRCKHKG